MMVLVGDNLLNETYDNTFSQELHIENVDFHPNYDNKAYFDVAIITTQEIIQFNVKVQPICLPEKPVAYVDNREGDLVTITGKIYLNNNIFRICRFLNSFYFL